MLIRSQDRESIINLSNVHSIDIVGFRKTSDGYFQDYDNANVWKVTYTSHEVMLYAAEYTSKEKAIKVLDMIQNAYVGCLWTDSHYDMAAQANVSDIVANNVVFEMPQDSEV